MSKINRFKKRCTSIKSNYDIENDMIIAWKITYYKTGERAIAEEMITKMCELGTRNEVLLFARGYPSRDFIQFIEEKQLKYLMS